MIDLFSLPYARKSTPSREGAKEAIPRAGSQAGRILEELRLCGSYGANSWELRQTTGIKQASTLSARLNQLVKMGLIRETDRVRKGEGKVETTVYVINN